MQTRMTKGAAKQINRRQSGFGRPVSAILWMTNQPKHNAANSGPSGRVKAAAARLNDAASRPRRLSL